MRLLTCILLSILPIFSLSQNLPSIEEKTKGWVKKDGYMPFYLDENTGKLWLEVARPEMEVLYQVSLSSALGSNDIGLDRGLQGDTRIIKFNREGRKLLMIQPNYAYRATGNDRNEQKAVEESFASATIGGFNIEAQSGSRMLIDATEFLLRDAMEAVNQIRSLKQGNYSLDKTRSFIYTSQCKNFDKNTELEASITLVNSDGEIGSFIRTAVASPEAITLGIHHSFVELPDNNYKPRVFDARSGFISFSYFDYSTPVYEPISKYYIIRHRLEKKDPAAASSEPVKKITYYLDNGTPEPIRTALLDGARWWNDAFEAAGYINAFEVKMLPDDADPMDIRYNMINWVHRSTRGWSYGASVVDPRTGEIIKGNVTLGSLRVRQDYLIASGLLAPFENGIPADNKMLKMALDRLKQLSAHEIGHTLGLMHNYSASVINRSSVMDYPPPVVRLDAKGEIDISGAYADGIGEWDKTSITWGYQDFPKGMDEKKALNDILATAYKKGLQFISDRDARDPGGAHPTAHLWDNGKNAVDELEQVMKVRTKALGRFGENTIRTGTPMAMIEDALVPIYLFHRYQLESVVKLIGGINYSYALKGDGQMITQPIPKSEQVTALNSLIATMDPSVLELPATLLKLIPPRPAGYAYTKELFTKRTGIVFDALSPAETAVDLPLSLLFNSSRLNRLVEYEVLYGGLGLSEMIDRLIKSTWKTTRKKGMQGLIQFQTEQLLLTYLLASSVDEKNSFITRSVLEKEISLLKNFINTQKKIVKDPLHTGHLLLALKRMESPAVAKPTIHAVMPPGAPIGCWE
jgi:hypothetical protein